MCQTAWAEETGVKASVPREMLELWGGHERFINGEQKLGQKLQSVRVLRKEECDANFRRGRTISGLKTTGSQQWPHLFSF